jgi:hypothetical protein
MCGVVVGLHHNSCLCPRVYWDLDIQTNAVIKHRGPSEVLPPHPDVELLRSQLILKLRQHYRELCQQREGEGSAASSRLYHLGLCGKGACGPQCVLWETRPVGVPALSC